MADKGSANRTAYSRMRAAQQAGRPLIDADTGVRTNRSLISDYIDDANADYEARRSSAKYRQASPADRSKARARARQRKSGGDGGAARNRTTNRTKTREYHIHINKGEGGAGGGAQGEWSRQSPIGDAEFFSAGHVRAFAERGRRAMRQAAMDFSYAHETLRAVLREVPPPQGESRGQMYAKANRTARSLKRAANAAQAASAHSARTWPAFMREYAPQLNTYGGPRPQRSQRMNFGG